MAMKTPRGYRLQIPVIVIFNQRDQSTPVPELLARDVQRPGSGTVPSR